MGRKSRLNNCWHSGGERRLLTEEEGVFGSTLLSGCLVSLNTERAETNADISISFAVLFFPLSWSKLFRFLCFWTPRFYSLLLILLRFPSLFCFSLFSLNCLCLPYPHFIHIPPSDRNDRSCLVLNESDVKKISHCRYLQFTAQRSPFTKPPPWNCLTYITYSSEMFEI